ATGRAPTCRSTARACAGWRRTTACRNSARARNSEQLVADYFATAAWTCWFAEYMQSASVQIHWRWMGATRALGRPVDVVRAPGGGPESLSGELQRGQVGGAGAMR